MHFNYMRIPFCLIFLFSRFLQIQSVTPDPCDEVFFLIWESYVAESYASYYFPPAPNLPTTKGDLIRNVALYPSGTTDIILITHGFSTDCITDVGPYSILRNAQAFYQNTLPLPIVICVDWSILAIPSSFNDPLTLVTNYIEAANNTDIVGKCVAKFITSVRAITGDKKFNIKILMGISLGAHVMGSAGNALSTNQVPFIIGLDPAGPLYSFLNLNFDLFPILLPVLFYSLNKNDATVVLIIHTSVPLGQFTILRGSGDVEYFVNSALIQKYCSPTRVCTPKRANFIEIDPLLIEPYLCSHVMSIVYLNEAIIIGSSTTNGYFGSRCLLQPPTLFCYLTLVSFSPKLIMGPSTKDIVQVQPSKEGVYALCTASCPNNLGPGYLSFSLGSNNNNFLCLLFNN